MGAEEDSGGRVSSTRPRWAEYEALAHEIVAELAPFADVKHNDHIVGTESESRRQIDVSARWKCGETESLLVVQVKDYKRKADVNTVGEFRSVIQDVRAQRGILICSGGFSKSAVTYARNIGIQQWSLADAKSRRWASELKVPTLWNKYSPAVGISAVVETRSAPLTIGPREDGSFDLWSGDQGDVPFSLTAEFEAKWQAGLLSLGLGIEHVFPLDSQLFVRATRADGTHENLELLDTSVTYAVSRQSYLAQLAPDDYRGIVDHLEGGVFFASRLDMDLPSLDSQVWTQVWDPERIAIDVRGSFVTLEDARISEPIWHGQELVRIGDAGTYRTNGG